MQIINTLKNSLHQSPSEQRKWKSVTVSLMLLCFQVMCEGQGTMTFTFNGQPAGTFGTISGYIESGMTFWDPYGPENLALTGPGLSGYPQDGTAYLEVTSGAKLGFELTPLTLFNLVSFDAAVRGINYPGTTLEVIGYQVMGVTVTNYFTLDSLADRRANNLPDFQTFTLDSQFNNVYRVDVLTDKWSLDNLVISGVPEPSGAALIGLGAVCSLGWIRVKGRRIR
jgi:hypothetical protein